MTHFFKCVIKEGKKKRGKKKKEKKIKKVVDIKKVVCYNWKYKVKFINSNKVVNLTKPNRRVKKWMIKNFI